MCLKTHFFLCPRKDLLIKRAWLGSQTSRLSIWCLAGWVCNFGLWRRAQLFSFHPQRPNLVFGENDFSDCIYNTKYHSPTPFSFIAVAYTGKLCKDYVNYNVWLPKNYTIETVENGLTQQGMTAANLALLQGNCFEPFMQYVCSSAFPRVENTSVGKSL